MTSLRVLIVEDNEDDALLIVRALEFGGYSVTFERVMSLAELEAALKPGSWDIVVSDFSLPQFDAASALAFVKSTGVDIPFIIASGTVGEENAIEALKAGAHDFVLKYRLARLVPAVQRELREAARRAEQRRMREQLTVSERLASVGTLAAGLAHEINNPLLVALANIELIKQDLARLQAGFATANGTGPSSVVASMQEPLGDAREALERMRDIVRDVKLFSRSADAERSSTIDVRAVLDSAVRMSWATIGRGARLVKEYGEVPGVVANEGRLAQVFLNLIVNAGQAMADSPGPNRLVIRTETTSDGCAMVTIEDTGCGIPPENLGRIFDPFYTTKPVVGTGLGLSICHRIIGDLGGSIEVESKVGQGTKFRVVLRAASTVEVDARGSVSTSDEPSPRRGRILVVDDEPMVGAAIRATLMREHEVTVTTSGEEARRLLAAGASFDLILCDLMMPHITGMDLHAMLRDTNPDQASRMVFLTGGAFTPAARAFLENLESESLEKPFDPDSLRAFVRSRVHG